MRGQQKCIKRQEVPGENLNNMNKAELRQIIKEEVSKAMKIGRAHV